VTAQRIRLAVTATLVAVVAVQSWLLYTPAPPNPVAEISGSDLVAHVVLFAVPSALAYWLWPRRSVLLGLLAYAPVSELIQLLVPNRMADVADGLADAVGVAIGAAIAGWVRRRDSQRRHSSR
jgi:VanZ family protein